MSQKQQILTMLENAGNLGVTGNQFYAACLPRFAARIKELRDQGYEISTERVDANHFVYKLSGDNSSSLESPKEARGNALQEPEQTGGVINASPVTPLQTEADGREYETNQVDVHRRPVEGAVSRSETPVSLSLFEVEVDRSPYGAEAA